MQCFVDALELKPFVKKSYELYMDGIGKEYHFYSFQQSLEKWQLGLFQFCLFGCASLDDS